MTAVKSMAAFCSLLFAAVALSFSHPFGNPRAGGAAFSPVFDGVEVPQPVRAKFEVACGDCHSQNTHYPLYSRVAPISWLVERDVIRGRQSFDMSRWHSYSDADRINALTRIASEVRTGQMPLRTYLMLHPTARLSAEEQSALYEWAKSERRLLRAGADGNVSSIGNDQRKSEP